MKKSVLITALLFAALFVQAQSAPYKIVYDLNSSDTSVQSTVLRQFNNVLKAAPDAQLEVVCHGQAIYMLVSNKGHFDDAISALKATGHVSFKVCANSMKRFAIDKSQLLSTADVVPVAVLELSQKQMEGWSYIKAGQ